MVATGREHSIQLPPPDPRPRGLFVDVAGKLTVEDTTYQNHDRLGQGIQHMPWGCDPLRTGPSNCAAEVLINGTGPAYDTQDPPEVIEANVDTGKGSALLDFDGYVTHPAFKVVDGLKCSTLSFPDVTSASFTGIAPRLMRRMRTLMSAALMGEFISGWASGGPSLSSEATVLNSVYGLDEAAFEIEQHLASTLLGNRGVVYIPPSLLHYALEACWVVLRDGRLETATGHLVVSDAGHDGTRGPSTPPSAGDFWIFASGEPAFRSSEPKLLGEGSETLALSTNIRERLIEAYAQLAFDPCPMGAVLATVVVGS